jgi:hypothetical protein
MGRLFGFEVRQDVEHVRGDELKIGAKGIDAGIR